MRHVFLILISLMIFECILDFINNIILCRLWILLYYLEEVCSSTKSTWHRFQTVSSAVAAAEISTSLFKLPAAAFQASTPGSLPSMCDLIKDLETFVQVWSSLPLQLPVLYNSSLTSLAALQGPKAQLKPLIIKLSSTLNCIKNVKYPLGKSNKV